MREIERQLETLPTADVAGADSAVVERLPEGPILYYAVPSGSGGVIVPVGEIDGDTLRALRATDDPAAFATRFIAEHMREGSEFVLFREGARAEGNPVVGAGHTRIPLI